MGDHYPKSNLELLSPDFKLETRTSLNTPFFVGSFAGFGVVAKFMHNYAAKRPLQSGLHLYAIWGLIGGAAGIFLNKYRHEYFADRDAVLRHYVSLHPEDFPEGDTKKYKDVFLPWRPNR